MDRRPEDAGLHLPERWGPIQESLGRIAGIALVTTDARGRTLAAAGVPELCRLIESRPEGSLRCAAWCGRHRELARTTGSAVTYRCHAGLQCFAVPVRVDGRAAGAILGGRTLERVPDVGDIEALATSLRLPAEELRRAVGGLRLGNPRLMEHAADLVARVAEAVVTGERRLADERTRCDLLRSLLALGADFARDQEPHEVYATVLETAAILFNLSGACLLAREEGSGRFRLRTAFGAPAAGLLPEGGLAADSPLLAPVLRSRGPVFTEDHVVLEGAGFPAGTRSFSLFPLLAGDRVLGILGVVDTVLGFQERSLLEVFCHQAALALQNALLREQLARRTRELERETRIRDRLAPLLEWEDVLQAVFEEAAQLAGAREASLMLLDRSSRVLWVARARGERAAVLRTLSVPAGEGIAGIVAAEGKPLLVVDVEDERRLSRPRRARYRTASCLVVPLTVRERVIGVINLADKTTDEPFSPEDLEAVLNITRQAACALQRSALHRKMRALREQAVTDALTGVGNRRYLEARLREETELSRRHGLPLSLVMLDLDDFKPYNDRAGHPAGDQLLAKVARLIRSQVRTSDIVVRYGGDEFAVLSPQTGKDEALRLAARIRRAMELHAFELPGLPERGGITLSAGVAALGNGATDQDSLLKAADDALYRAKAEGHSRVTPIRA